MENVVCGDGCRVAKLADANGGAVANAAVFHNDHRQCRKVVLFANGFERSVRHSGRHDGANGKNRNHEAAVALHFMHYNFCRIHQTLRCKPAMEANVADHVWTLEEIIGLIA